MEQPKPNLDRQNQFRECFSTPSGKKVLAMLADYADFFSYVNVDSSELQLANLAGRRSMILFIMEMLGINDIEGIVRALLTVPVVVPEEDQIEEEADL